MISTRKEVNWKGKVSLTLSRDFQIALPSLQYEKERERLIKKMEVWEGRESKDKRGKAFQSVNPSKFIYHFKTICHFSICSAHFMLKYLNVLV